MWYGKTCCSTGLFRVSNDCNLGNDSGLCLGVSALPGGFLPFSAGNVRDGELLDFYRASPVFKALCDEDGFAGKCGYCEYRRLCGGSRARAYAMTGDYLASEPLCEYQPVRQSHSVQQFLRFLATKITLFLGRQAGQCLQLFPTHDLRPGTAKTGPHDNDDPA